MATDARLKIVFEALDMASGEIKGLKKDLEGVDDNSKKASGGIGNLTSVVAQGAAAVTAFGFAAKKAFDLAKEGAMLEFTATKFDRLAQSVGTTKDALLSDLREATRGTTSDMELLAAATDFMSLGLAKSHDEVVRLSNVAGALGMNMNQLVLTLTNQTTMRFDAIGVAVDGFDERLQALKDTGMDTQEAFTEAFLQQAEEQIERVGHVAETSAGQFMQFEAAAANAGDSLKRGFAGVITPTIGVFNSLIDLFSVGASAVKMFGAEATGLPGIFRTASGELVTITELIRMYNGTMALAEGATDGWAASLLATEEAAETAGNAASATMDDLKGMTDQMILSSVAGDMSADALRDLAVQMGFMSESEALLIEREKELERQRQMGIISSSQYAQSVSSLRQALEDLPEDIRIQILLDIEGMGALNQLQRATRSGGITGGGGGGDFARADGGFIRQEGITSVGERGEEAVVWIGGIPYVIPNDEWNMMKAAGVRPGKGMQFGGPLLDGVAGVGAVRSGAFSTNRSLRGFFDATRRDAAQSGGMLPGGGNVGFPQGTPVPVQGGSGGSGSTQQTTSTQQQQAVAEVATQAAVEAATQAASSSQQAGQTGAAASVGISVRAGIADIGFSIERSNTKLLSEVRGLRDDIRRLERAQSDMIERVVDLA